MSPQRVTAGIRTSPGTLRIMVSVYCHGIYLSRGGLTGAPWRYIRSEYGESPNHDDGLPVRAMRIRVAPPTELYPGTEGLPEPEMQEPVLERAQEEGVPHAHL